MNKIFIFKPDIYFLTGVLLALISAVLGIYSFLFLLIFPAYLMQRKWGDRTLMFLSIFLYLTFISDVIHSFRVVIQVLGFLTLVYIFIKRFGFNTKGYPGVPKIILRFIILLYFSMIISTVFSQYFLAGVEQIIKQSIFFLIIFMVYSFLDKMEFIKTVLFALGFATTIVTISILYEYVLNGFNVIDYVQGIQIRMTGILTNVNAAGSYFGAIFPVSLALTRIVKGRKNKNLLIALNLFFFIGIIFTTSRSAYLAIVISTIFIFYMLNKKLLIKVFIGMTTFTVIVLIIPQLYNFFSLFFRIESGISQRDHLWALSFQMIKDHPFFGIGPGAYSYEMINYFPVLLNTWVGQQLIILRDVTFGANNSHNFFLFFASDMGFFGLITAILFPIIFFKMGMETINKYKGNNLEIYTLTVGIVGAGLGLFFRGIFEEIGLITYGWITMDLPFWIIFTILISLHVHNYNRTEEFELDLIQNDH